MFGGLGGIAALANPAALIGTAAQMGGAYLGYKGQQEANQTNRAIANQQMDFQSGMSNTAYQRATQDMRAAGLNPMLAYSQGGASAPQGASAVMQNEMEGLGQSAKTMFDQVMQVQSLKKLEADVDAQKANAAATRKQEQFTAANIDKTKKETKILGTKAEIDDTAKTILQPILNRIKSMGTSTSKQSIVPENKKPVIHDDSIMGKALRWLRKEKETK